MRFGKGADVAGEGRVDWGRQSRGSWNHRAILHGSEDSSLKADSYGCEIRGKCVSRIAIIVKALSRSRTRIENSPDIIIMVEIVGFCSGIN